MEDQETNIPEALKYTDEHEWIALEDGVGTIGITDYAQSELGDIVYVELPEVGDQLEKGQVFGTIEAVKTASELYAPVAGEVVEINTTLEEDAEQVNTEPYDAGWMVKIRLASADEVGQLLSAQEYTELLDGL
jgi:glycine cleavage system H protein